MRTAHCQSTLARHKHDADDWNLGHLHDAADVRSGHEKTVCDHLSGLSDEYEGVLQLRRERESLSGDRTGHHPRDAFWIRRVGPAGHVFLRRSNDVDLYLAG